MYSTPSIVTDLIMYYCFSYIICPVSDGACLGFVIIFGAVVYGLVALGQNSFVFAFYTTVAFVLGALTSIFSGWVGMKVCDGG